MKDEVQPIQPVVAKMKWKVSGQEKERDFKDLINLFEFALDSKIYYFKVSHYGGEWQDGMDLFNGFRKLFEPLET